jgi:hypothetical protein
MSRSRGKEKKKKEKKKEKAPQISPDDDAILSLHSDHRSSIILYRIWLDESQTLTSNCGKRAKKKKKQKKRKKTKTKTKTKTRKTSWPLPMMLILQASFDSGQSNHYSPNKKITKFFGSD